MILAQGRFWRAEMKRGGEFVVLSILKDGIRGALPTEAQEELRDLRIEVPLEHWNRVVKHVRSDRKLVGGILLDFARTKDALPAAIARDRLYHGLQNVVGEATIALLEEGLLALGLPEKRGRTTGEHAVQR